MAVNWTELDRLAQAHVSVSPVANEEALIRQLQVWWCLKYSRPLKDPLLEDYTIDDLIYEYLIWHYMEPANDPAEKKRREQQAKADEQWILDKLAKRNPIPKAEETPAPEIQMPSEIPDLPEISTKFDG